MFAGNFQPWRGASRADVAFGKETEGVAARGGMSVSW
jgi:hypothetical protein